MSTSTSPVNRLLLVVALLVTLTATLSGGVIGATSSPWAIKYVAASNQSFLWGVSCSSATACTAVGSSGNGPLAERWDGTSWAGQSLADPSGVSLHDVDCPSASDCEAVGSTSQGPVAERWNGTDWVAQRTPGLPGTLGELSGVSCSSPSACLAVGKYEIDTNSYYTDLPLAERWNGSTWTLDSPPNPPGDDNALAGVSCSSATACTAVGSQTGAVLVERWNGASWSTQTTPSVSGAELLGVSCPSPSACTAVGDQLGSSTGIVLAERWDGTDWVVQPAPNPAGRDSQLTGVSCVTTSDCTAVGTYGTGFNGPYLTLAERWGGSWAIQTTANPPDDNGLVSPSEPLIPGLVGVSCATSSACTAVGAYTSSSGQFGLGEEYGSTTTTPVPTTTTTRAKTHPGQPAKPEGGVAGTYDLSGVACETAKLCIAVGDGNFSPHQGTVLSISDGTPARPKKAPGADNLLGIACPGATSCIAVGSVSGSPNAEGVVVPINAGVPSAAEVVAGASELEAVACTDSTTCVGVGSNYSIGGGGFVVPITDGVPGQVEDVAGARDLDGIACSGTGACVAVGDAAAPGGGIVVTVTNGAPATPQPVSGAYFLTSVACTSAADCYAIGPSTTEIAASDTSQGFLVAIVDGAPQPGVLVPRTGSGKWAEFSYAALACATSSRCEAVGANTTAGQYAYRSVALPVSDGKPGRYRVVAGSSQLYGVACPGAGTCEAVGEQFYTTAHQGGVQERGLVVRLST
jgi:hypothetical protein